MIAARKFISDLLFIKYLVLRWEINIRKGERDQTRGGKKKKKSRRGGMRCCGAGWKGLVPQGGFAPLFTSPGTEEKGSHTAGTATLGTCGCSPLPGVHPCMQGIQSWGYQPSGCWFLQPEMLLAHHQPKNLTTKHHCWFAPQLPLQPPTRDELQTSFEPPLPAKPDNLLPCV